MRATSLLLFSVAVVFGCSNSTPSYPDGGRPVPLDDAVDAYCDAYCGLLDGCGELGMDSLQDCVDECQADGPPDGCVITEGELEACVGGFQATSCADLDLLVDPTDLGIPACEQICDEPSSGDGGPGGVDPSGAFSWCDGSMYISGAPACDQSDQCVNAFCESCDGLLRACSRSPGACASSSASAPVACEVQWVDCLLTGPINCGDPTVGATITACRDAYTTCAGPP